jgi:hypothetical protein
MSKNLVLIAIPTALINLLIAWFFSASGPQKVTTAATSLSSRSETALVTAKVGSTPSLVTAFNDFSPIVPELTFPDNGVTWHVCKGASYIGWATSADGQAWSYKGKVHAPSGWAGLGSDPGLAVNPKSPNVVYLSALATSDQAWQHAYGATTGCVDLIDADIPPRDGFCVFRSQDGGATFPEASCVPSSDIADPHADLPAIAVDYTGGVWVAILDTVAGVHTVKFYRSPPNTWKTLGSFVPQCGKTVPDDGLCPTPDEVLKYIGTAEPRLIADVNADFGGYVWLTTVSPQTPELFLVGFDPADGLAWVYNGLTGPCLVKNLLKGGSDVTLPGGNTVRNVFRHSAERGVNAAGWPVLRWAYEYAEPWNNNARRVGLAELKWDPGNDYEASCEPVPSWYTTNAPAGGQQFMAHLDYEPRFGPGSSAWGDWWLVFLTTEQSPDVNKPYLQPKAHALGGDPGLAPFLVPKFLAPSSWYACRFNGGYWGDYFGLAQFQDSTGVWRSLATFSDSRPAPSCTVEKKLAAPLEIASARWW